MPILWTTYFSPFRSPILRACRTLPLTMPTCPQLLNDDASYVRMTPGEQIRKNLKLSRYVRCVVPAILGHGPVSSSCIDHQGGSQPGLWWTCAIWPQRACPHRVHVGVSAAATLCTGLSQMKHWSLSMLWAFLCHLPWDLYCLAFLKEAFGHIIQDILLLCLDQ